MQADALYATSADGLLASRWPTQAIETEAISPFAHKSAGVDEGGRQLAFLGPPKVGDAHVVHGRRRDLVGTVVTLTIDSLGYDAGVACYVIGADETQVPGCTVLTVLRRI
ncbi:hypothetical protein WP12_03480 [Sphingomonas sp. SRS2]|nr:hypothetical protein WP12_03480 [Sphingomonas sp. SRS2]